MNTTLLQAINDSVCETRNVSVEFDGDIDGCIDELNDAFDGEIDYVQLNDHTYDVWGWTDETPENEQDWRLTVTVRA